MNSETQNLPDTQDTTELLAQLKGIHLPDAPIAASLWPMYLSLAVCAIALIVFALRHFTVKKTWHNTALKNLTKIQKHTTNGSLQHTASLLKRIALTNDSRESVQHLSGERWLQYLDNFFATNFFSEGDGRIFGTALYQRDTFVDEHLYKNLKQLIKRHKRQHS